MRTNWIGKSVVALSMAAACAVPACDSSKTEPVATTTGAATPGLQPGDVAVTCFNTANNPGDFLQIVPLTAIDNDTDIKLTDREATAAGVFNTNNESINVVVPLRPADAGIAVIAAGTPILLNPPGTGLGNGEETVFLYQGTLSTTPDAGALTGQFLWGFQISTNGGWAAMRDDANDLSERLTALNGNDVALSSAAEAGQLVMFYYTGTTTGTKAQLRAAIANPANWASATAANVALCPTAFTVVPDATDGAIDVPVDAPRVDSGAAGAAGDAAVDSGGTPGTGGAAGSADAGPGTGGMTGTDGAVDSGTDVTGTGGMGVGGSTDAGTDVTGTGGMGVGGSTDAGTDVTGTGGRIDSGTDVAGTGGRTDSGTDVAGTGGSSGDAGGDVRPDSGTATDVRPDTISATDAKADTKADAGTDKGSGGGSSGCSCSTTSSTTDSLATSAWLLALGGVIFTARRRRRKQ